MNAVTDRADDYAVTYTSDADGNLVAQLFHRNDQWAELIAAKDGVRVMLFGPPSGEPPARDLEFVLDVLRGAARQLDELSGR